MIEKLVTNKDDSPTAIRVVSNESVFESQLEKFLNENPLNLDIPKRKENIKDIKESKNKEYIGDYVVANDFNLATEGTKVTLAYRNDIDDKILVVKEIAKEKMKELGRLSQWDNITDVEEYLKEKEFNNPVVLMPDEIIKRDDKIYRFYEAMDINLEKYLETHNQIPINESASLILRASEGVEALNKFGVINVDFAPLNILLNSESIKLIDLDDASILKDDSDFCSKNSLGNNRFTSAPELFEKNPIFNKTVDVYAVSATFYRLIVGNWPYNIEEETLSVVEKDKQASYQKWKEKQAAYKKLHEEGKINFPDTIPKEIQEVIKKGMKPNSKERYQSIKEFSHALINALEKIKDYKNSETTLRVDQQENLTFVEKEMPLDSIPNDTLLKNSNAELDPEREIEMYFERQDSDYIKQLESLNERIGEPMDKETKLVACIPVAGHQEANNIYQALESYYKQNANPNEFEVLLFVNSPENVEIEKKEEIKKTMSEIERAKKDFPNLKVRVTQAFLPQDQVRIGNIRKIGTDLALLRQKEAGIERDLILLSNDVDNQGLSEEYVDSYLKYFEENSEKEGAVGNLQYDPNAFIRFPVIHVQQEFSTFLDQVGFKNGNVTLLGSNSCMKSSIYASIGGYPPGLKTAEQDWTGKTIRKLRQKKSTLGFVKDGPLVTSSRRRVATLILNMKSKIEFGDQETEKKMRELNLESFPIFDYSNKEAIIKLEKDLRQAINKLITSYDEGEKLGKNANYYKTNLKKVGIEYIVDEDNILHLINIDKFIERQELMQKMIKGGEKNMAKVIEESWKI